MMTLSPESPAPSQPIEPPNASALEALVKALSAAPVATPEAPVEDPAEAPAGALPASWYRADGEAAPSRAFELTWPAAAGAVAGATLVAFAIVFVARERAAPAAAPPQLLASFDTTQTVIEGALQTLAPDQAMASLVGLARARATTGDVLVARTLLARADAARDAAALFLMAETYDPARLADWGVDDVPADPVRARALYAAANALGHPDADARLAALPVH
jgi:hypothetical protein